MSADPAVQLTDTAIKYLWDLHQRLVYRGPSCDHIFLGDALRRLEYLEQQVGAATDSNLANADRLAFLQKEGWCWTNEQIDRYRGICRDRRGDPNL